MALNCGIVGLPNVGKSTLFSALTHVPVDAANYPFCTIEPNVAVVPVPDPRLARITEVIATERVVPTTVEFVDIAGLVRGASKGEGRGNRFLAHIRQTGLIVHVVRCFRDDDITHVDGSVDPARDIDTIDLELALADLETVEKRIARVAKDAKSQDTAVRSSAKVAEPLLARVAAQLGDGRPVRALELTTDERNVLADLQLITAKPVLYLCNVDEEGIAAPNAHERQVREHAAAAGARVLRICGKLESEIAALDAADERDAFLRDAGLSEPGLAELIREGYEGLSLRTFFTAGPKEVRAWTIAAGATAPEAAGVIHSDFQRGFIRAETYHVDDLIAAGSERQLRRDGKLRQEGKDYVVRDGDVMLFRFNT